MTLRTILHWPDPALRAVAEPVEEITDDIRALAADLLETMYAAPGRGLAATQIGVMRRVFVVDVEWKDGPANPLVMINPEIVSASGETAICEEGCLSVPGLLVPIERPAGVRLRWLGLCGTVQERDFDGIAAVCVQHEHDHLDGRLHIDRLDPEARAAVGPTLDALEARA